MTFQAKERNKLLKIRLFTMLYVRMYVSLLKYYGTFICYIQIYSFKLIQFASFTFFLFLHYYCLMSILFKSFSLI